MKAKTWFESRGRAMRSAGYTWPEVKRTLNLYALPKWAQSAIARGHMLQGEHP